MDVVPTISSAADESDNARSSSSSSNPHPPPHPGSAVIAPEETTLSEHHQQQPQSAPAHNHNTAATTASANDGPVSIQEEAGSDEEDEFEYEYEDEDDAAYGGFLSVNNSLLESTALANATSAAAAEGEPATIEEDTDVAKSDPPEEASKKPAWREPSREAVNMSLRAEKETSGSKRRLAQDLYRIMNKDTQETGFSLSPSKEDCMDKWTIKLFQFDAESNLAKDMLVLGLDAIQLEMSFPDQYPFEPPFVRVVRPRFKRQTGFVMNGAICMELLTKEGWNPINDIESVIVSIRSLLVVGEGRLEAAFNLTETKYKALLEAAEAVKAASQKSDGEGDDGNDDDNSEPLEGAKRARKNSAGDHHAVGSAAADLSEQQRKLLLADAKYSEADAKAAYEHLSSYHKKKGWDTSGWWARKG